MATIKNSPFKIIEQPLITEKTAIAGSASNTVVFKVHTKANKAEIKRAVEKIFDVKVSAVRTINMMGKIKRVGQTVGRRNAWKKAYVSLAKGSSIDFVEGL